MLPLTIAAWAQNSSSAKPGDDCSGMYSFLKDGEFLQITVEDQGRVTGFISRYGDSESDQGAFLNQFFKEGRLNGDRLTFTTTTVHGVWYEFKGLVARGQAKNAGDEGYYVLKGILAEHRPDSQKSKEHEVELKSFPQDRAPVPPKD